MRCILPRPLKVQYKEVVESPSLLQPFDLETKFIISGRTLINKLWVCVAYKELET